MVYSVVAIITGWLADRIGLTEAMVWTTPFPCVCAAFFIAFYWTYPRDGEKLHAEMAVRAEEIGGG